MYTLKVTQTTWFKRTPEQSSQLPATSRTAVVVGAVYPLSSYAVAGDHYKISLGKDAAGNQISIKGINTWFVYQSHVEILQDGKPIDAVHRSIDGKGLSLLKKFEGCERTAYRDAVGVWTIGYGTTQGVCEGQTITQAQAEQLLRKDLDIFESGVATALTIGVNDDQFSALVCFAYNVGLGAFCSSTLLRLLNMGYYGDAADQFLLWNKAGGNELLGLTRRRKAERALFLGQDFTAF